MSKQELQTIDPAALARVSGGTTTAATTTTGNDQILTALTGILSSIQSLAAPQSNGFNQQEMLMMMMIMSQRSQPVAVAGPDPWGAWGQQPIIRYY
jgi:hypothetical protein